MFQVLLSYLRWIQCWCHDLHLSQSSSQHHSSPLPAITCKHQTNTNTAAAPHVTIPPQQQPCTVHGHQTIYRWSYAWHVPRSWMFLCLQDHWDYGDCVCSCFWPALQQQPPVQRWPLGTTAAAPSSPRGRPLYCSTHTCKHKYLMQMTPRFIVFTCYIAYTII